MSRQPNILLVIADGMQARVLDADHPCRTPNLDRLAARGVRLTRAYTPLPTCSPARASLMTGLLPHNHGVLQVEHVVDDDPVYLGQPGITALGAHQRRGRNLVGLDQPQVELHR